MITLAERAADGLRAHGTISMAEQPGVHMPDVLLPSSADDIAYAEMVQCAPILYLTLDPLERLANSLPLLDWVHWLHSLQVRPPARVSQGGLLPGCNPSCCTCQKALVASLAVSFLLAAPRAERGSLALGSAPLRPARSRCP